MGKFIFVKCYKFAGDLYPKFYSFVCDLCA